MTADFDPYLKWLGIKPKDQPPHHYRLLGIDLFEDDADKNDESGQRSSDLIKSRNTVPTDSNASPLAPNDKPPSKPTEATSTNPTSDDAQESKSTTSGTAVASDPSRGDGLSDSTPMQSGNKLIDVLKDDAEYKERGKVLLKKGDLLLDFEDNTLYRLQLNGKTLYIERFHPRSDYPHKIEWYGEGTRRSG